MARSASEPTLTQGYLSIIAKQTTRQIEIDGFIFYLKVSQLSA